MDESENSTGAAWRILVSSPASVCSLAGPRSVRVHNLLPPVYDPLGGADGHHSITIWRPGRHDFNGRPPLF